LLGERVFGIGVHDLQHVAGADPTESEALVLNRDHPVSVFEYRSLFHIRLDAGFRRRDASPMPLDNNAQSWLGVLSDTEQSLIV
jgi:hypothetical protein